MNILPVEASSAPQSFFYNVTIKETRLRHLLLPGSPLTVVLVNCSDGFS